MPKIDIRKHATPDAVHYETVSKAVFETDIALLRQVTPAGRALLARAPDFCRMERAILHRLGKGRKLSKPGLMREFGFPGRMVNAALDSAQGHLDGTRECAKASLEGTTEAITRVWAHCLFALREPSQQGELHGRKRHLNRLIHQEAQMEQRVEHPKVFFGREEHRHQFEDADWKQAYHARRSDHLSANGGADETAGNSTLQVSLGPAEERGGRLWQWFHLAHARQHLGRFRLESDLCEHLTRAVTANRATRTFREVEAWYDAQGKKISERKQRQMEADDEAPASKQQHSRAVTIDRVGLTIDLRRSEHRNRWYIHVARSQELPAAYAPQSWLGVDLNVDSIASALVAIQHGEPVVREYRKEFFPANGPAGPRKMAVFTLINRLVEEAKAARAGVCLEYLDFEGCKRWLKTKLGALLRVMPYREIRGAFERRCLEAAVPFRYVPPKYSSVLGAIVSQRWPGIGRDQAAAVVLALRAEAVGNRWLERTCEAVVRAERVSLRFNAKGKFGHSAVLVASPPPGRMSDRHRGHQRDHPRQPAEPAFFWQVAAGRKIQGGFSSLLESWREQRRAAKAQKHSIPPPCFKMPHQLAVLPDHPPVPRPRADSSLRKVA